MANERHSTATGRPAVDVMVGDAQLDDAMGELWHNARILTLAIVGLIHTPHEVHGHQAGPFTYDRDNDWTNDIEALAFDVVQDLEKILNAMEAGGQS